MTLGNVPPPLKNSRSEWHWMIYPHPTPQKFKVKLTLSDVPFLKIHSWNQDRCDIGQSNPPPIPEKFKVGIKVKVTLGDVAPSPQFQDQNWTKSRVSQWVLNEISRKLQNRACFLSWLKWVQEVLCYSQNWKLDPYCQVMYPPSPPSDLIQTEDYSAISCTISPTTSLLHVTLFTFHSFFCTVTDERQSWIFNCNTHYAVVT